MTGLLILSIKAGWCTDSDSAEAIQQGASVMPIPYVLKKFGLTMGGVIVSLAIIWFGLNIFKKFSTKLQNNNKNLYNDGLNSPKNVDDAIILFINKNKLN